MPFPPPIVLCMLLCDAIHTDPTSEKRFVLGTIDSIQTPPRGVMPQSVWLYAELTNGHGPTLVQVRVLRSSVDEIEGEFLISTEMLFDFAAPRQVMFLTLRIDGVLFQRAVEHRVILSYAGSDLLERRFLVLPTEAGGRE